MIFLFWNVKKQKQEGETMKKKNKTARNRNKHIKIKKPVIGLQATNAGILKKEFWVQITKDEVGATLSIDDYTIPLEPLGIEIKEKK